jgi:hypothetical protein
MFKHYFIIRRNQAEINTISEIKKNVTFARAVVANQRSGWRLRTHWCRIVLIVIHAKNERKKKLRVMNYCYGPDWSSSRVARILEGSWRRKKRSSKQVDPDMILDETLWQQEVTWVYNVRLIVSSFSTMLRAQGRTALWRAWTCLWREGKETEQRFRGGVWGWKKGSRVGSVASSLGDTSPPTHQCTHSRRQYESYFCDTYAW